MQADEQNKPAGAQSFLTDELERICNEVMAEYGMSFGGVYLDFAKEVAKRSVDLEREACAAACEELISTAREFHMNEGAEMIEICASTIRERSNA